jgi:hypothetical protein
MVQIRVWWWAFVVTSEEPLDSVMTGLLMGQYLSAA